VNERVAELDARLQGTADETPLEVHCECGAVPGCEERVTMPRAAYERVRAQDDRFALAPGHENLELESVVERGDSWVIVDKLPPFEPLVADDPRGKPSS
jgi:hypothetical protein